MIKPTFSEEKPTTEGYYFHKSSISNIKMIYVGRKQKTSSKFGLPFNYGLSITFDGEDIPLGWVCGEFSEKIDI